MTQTETSYAEQIQRIEALCASIGRPRPKIQVAFRPILAPTEEAAWERAYAIVERIRQRQQKNPWIRKGSGGPQNTGSKRLIEIAKQGERYDRCMFTGTALATGGSGNSNALVGTPETVAAALLDYVDLGVDILSARGYDSLQDTIDFGQQVIPIVREEVATRDSEREAVRS
jgi:alkanesulfonate monooxygenase